MSRVVFAMTEAQYQAIVLAYEHRPAVKRLRSVSAALEARGFLRRDWDRGYGFWQIAAAGRAIIELGLALQAHERELAKFDKAMSKAGRAGVNLTPADRAAVRDLAAQLEQREAAGDQAGDDSTETKGADCVR